MSVVADPKGFTLSGPDPGTERTIPWEQTTGFTCQRPARLLDGSPATVLEVGLANGRVLELLLPVTRVPPSETVVVETELAVMAEQYGGQKPGSDPQAQVQPQAHRTEPSDRSSGASGSAPAVSSGGSGSGSSGRSGPAAPASSNGQPPSGAGTQPPRPNAPEPRQRSREQLPALALQGARTNGRSAKASSTVAPDALAPATSAASRPAPVADRVSVQAVPETVSATSAGPAVVTPATAEPAMHEPASAEPAPSKPAAAPAGMTRRQVRDEVEVVTRTAEQDEAQSSSVERRENRMLTLLVALIGIVVVVLIAELVLILFVLNHNPSTKGKSIGSQTTTLIYYPNSVVRL